jgi:tetratricopeptide (TPR) repeat protein
MVIAVPDADKEILAGERKLAEMDFPAALSRFRKAVKLDPNSPAAYFGKAEAALGVPKIPAEDVIADYQQAIKLDPDNAFFHARLGSFCIEVGQWELAEESYNRAAEVDPDNGYLYFSEFGLEYYYGYLTKLGDEAGPNVQEEAIRKSLGYLLRSLNLTESEAKKLL